MKRRTFLQGGATAALATSAVAKPVIAQTAPELKWRLTSSFPKSLGRIFGTAQTFAKYVADATDNKFQIQTFAAGEIVPGEVPVQPAYDSGIEDFIRPIFEQSYTMSFENYPVEIERLKRPEQITLRPKPE